MGFKEEIIMDTVCVAQNMKKTGDTLYEATRGADQMEHFERCVMTAISAVESIYRKLVALKGKIGFCPTYQVLPTDASMRIEYNGNMYHFILNERLPHRLTIDKYGKKLKYDYDSNIYYSGYRRAVEEYLEANGNEVYRFDRKVVLYVLTHGTKGHMLDNDNIEVKTFIDAAIKGIFVRDDSPQYLLICVDSVADGEDYTEAFLGHTKDVMDLVYKFHQDQ